MGIRLVPQPPLYLVTCDLCGREQRGPAHVSTQDAQASALRDGWERREVFFGQCWTCPRCLPTIGEHKDRLSDLF